MTLTRDETRLVLSLVSRAVEQAPNGVSPVWLAIQGKLLDMAEELKGFIAENEGKLKTKS